MKDEKDNTPVTDSSSSLILHPYLMRVSSWRLQRRCNHPRENLPGTSHSAADHIRVLQDAAREEAQFASYEEAHKLCGMVAAFSTVAGEVASDLEDRAAQGQLDDGGPGRGTRKMAQNSCGR